MLCNTKPEDGFWHLLTLDLCLQYQTHNVCMSGRTEGCEAASELQH